MMAHHGIVLAVILPSFAGSVPPAVARGGLTSNDPPWNSEHISRLPEEIRKALLRLCGDSAFMAPPRKRNARLVSAGSANARD